MQVWVQKVKEHTGNEEIEKELEKGIWRIEMLNL